jgi:hypothetical protein
MIISHWSALILLFCVMILCGFGIFVSTAPYIDALIVFFSILVSGFWEKILKSLFNIEVE